MAEDVSGGGLYLDVLADARSFRRDLRAKVDAATKRVKARVEVEIDAQQLAAKTRAAARAAEAKAKIQAKVEFNAQQVRRALTVALREGSRGAKVHADVEFSASRTRTALQAALREAGAGVRGPSVRVGVNPAIREADARLAAWRREQERRAIRLRVDPSGLIGIGKTIETIGTVITSLTAFPAIASGILVAAGALTNLTGALFSVASAGGTAIGTLAALPGIAAAGAQGLIAVALGFAGIGGAVKAMGQAERQAGQTAGKSASQQAAAAEQIKAARDRLADAREEAAKRVSDAEKAGVESIRSAQQNHITALKNEKKAEEELTKARAEAREELQQQLFQLREATLGEEQAQINLEHARAKVLQARQSTVISPLDRRQAELDYRQAQLDLAEAKDRTSDLTAEQAKSAKAGVEGSDTVKAAKEQLKDANDDVSKSEKELKQARRDAVTSVNDARKAGAKQIASAQQALRQAMRSSEDQANATSASVNALDAAMDKLSPAGQKFARFVKNTLLPRFKQMRFAVQTALLPPLQKGITAGLPLLDELERAFADSGKVIGEWSIRAGKLVGSAPFRKDTRTIMAGNNEVLENFADTGLYLADALRHVMVVATPMVIRFSELVERWAKGRAEAAKTGRETGKMAAYFERAQQAGGKLMKILKNFGKALANIGKASRPSGNSLLDSLVESTDKLQKWTADPENQKKMQAFFEGVVPIARAFGDLLNHIVETLVRLGRATGGHQLDGLFAVLNAFLTVLETIADMPGGGTVLTTILLLAGAGLGLGIVVKYFGSLIKNIGKLLKFTGLARLFRMLFGRRQRSALGGLADDADAMGDAIDRELPKDKKKTQALDDVGGAAGGASKPLKGAGDEAEKLGVKAEKSAKKTGLLSRMFGRLGKAGRGLGGLLSGLFALPALAAIGGKISGTSVFKSITAFFASIGAFFSRQGRRLGQRIGSIWKTIWGGLTRFRLPGIGAILAKIGGWAKGLWVGIGALFAKIFKNPKNLIAKVGGGAAKGGAKGGAGGIFGILAGVLAGIVGSIIGGGKGGKRGALGGAISGGGSGAGIGGTIGSIVPVIGTAIGAAVGGIVGAIVGAITGGKYWSAIGTFFGKTLPGWIVSQVKKVPGLVMAGLGAVAGFGSFLWSWLWKGLSAVGTFFTKTMPDYVRAQAAKLPGLLRSGLSAAGGLASALGAWAWKELKNFGSWLGRALLSTLENLPVLIVDAIFLIPELIASAAASLPLIFGWILKQAWWVVKLLFKVWIGIPTLAAKALIWGAKKIPSVFGWLLKAAWWAVKMTFKIVVGLPVLLFRALTFGVRNAPKLFSWLWVQAERVRKALPGIIWRAVLAVGTAFGKGMARAGARVNEHLASITGKYRLAASRWWALIRNTYNNIVKTVREKLASARDWVTGHLRSIGKRFSLAKDAMLAPWRSAFNWIRSIVTDKLGAAKKNVENLLSNIKKSFSSAVSSIGRIWEGLKKILATPVNWIGNNVYNKGIWEVWHMVASKVGGGDLPKYKPFARGGITPGYTPGRDVHRYYSPTGGGLDLSGGEAIMVPEWTKAMGAGRVKRWNALARSLGPGAVMAAMAQEFGGAASGYLGGFDSGGILGSITGGVSALADAARGLFAKGVRKAANLVFDPVLNAIATGMGKTGDFGAMLGKIPKNLIDRVLEYLVKVIEPKLGGQAGNVVKAAKSMVGMGDSASGRDNDNWITQKWGMVGAPWCAMFASEAIKKGKAEKAYPGYPTAAVLGYYNAMQHVDTDAGRPGDLAVYYGPPPHHINIIEKKEPSGGYMTIGGNQNSLVQRDVRGGQSGILRPKFSLGGILADQAAQIFQNEVPNDDKHEMNTPLVRLMRNLSPGLNKTLAAALIRTKTAIADPIHAAVHDSGGPIEKGLNLIANWTGKQEWTLTPDAVDALGGPRAVASLNSSARSLHASRSGGRTKAAAPSAAIGASKSATVIVNPQPRQNEVEIAYRTAHLVGGMIK